MQGLIAPTGWTHKGCDDTLFFLIFQWLLVTWWSHPVSSFPVCLYTVKCTVKGKKIAKQMILEKKKNILQCFRSYFCKMCWGEYKVCSCRSSLVLLDEDTSRVITRDSTPFSFQGFRRETSATVGTVIWSSCLKFLFCCSAHTIDLCLKCVLWYF